LLLLKGEACDRWTFFLAVSWNPDHDLWIVTLSLDHNRSDEIQNGAEHNDQ
jgi:hypothetical protein